jgi:cytosine/adenosine deaminase-related metal-dependent hydrolase
MRNSSNFQAFERGQARWDFASDYDDRPDPVLEEREERIRTLMNNQELLIHELRECADRLGRRVPGGGDRFIETCNEIEGVEDDE